MQTASLDEIDLGPFCDPDSYRYAMESPWVMKGVRYATNSRVLVWHDTEQPDTPEGEKKLISADKVTCKYVDVVRNREFPASFPDCPDCGQAGQETRFECSTCKGSGEEKCDLGHMHDCSDCRGNGFVRGDGDKKIFIRCENKECAIVIDSWKFDRVFMNSVASLPGKKLFGLKVTGDHAAMVIDCDNGLHAVLMSLSKRYS